LLLAGRTRWVWIGLFAGLAVIPLIFFIGLAEGLEKGLYPMVGCIIFSAYVIVNQEIETARLRSQVMITKLQETRQQLGLRASHIEEIAAIEERNQLAREIHDSVSQTLFSIELNIRLAEILLERDPAQVLSQLEKLKILTQQALAQMRSLIAYLRPRSNEMLQGDQLTHHAGQEGLADQQIA
jgi:signal transduction histidine kinase